MKGTVIIGDRRPVRFSGGLWDLHVLFERHVDETPEFHSEDGMTTVRHIRNVRHQLGARRPYLEQWVYRSLSGFTMKGQQLG